MSSLFSSLTASSGPTPAPSQLSFPEIYERVLVGPLFRPWSEALLDRVQLAPGCRVLDVACGTGIVARLANQRLEGRGRVVGVDRTPAMLAVARAVEPTIDWREGDAADLPLKEGEQFDVVTCHQGLQFFPDKPVAVRSMRRALVTGGQIAIGVWRSLEENSVFQDLGQVAERFVGPISDARHSFPDPDALAALLTDAGFGRVRVERAARQVRFAVPAADLARLNATAVVAMSAAGKAMSESERAEAMTTIVEESLPAVARYTNDGVITFQTSANLGTGHA